MHMQKFEQVQNELGLRSQLFQTKFVYSQHQNLSQETYLLPLFKPLPSQLAGFTHQDIRVIHAFAADLIFKAGESLCVPVSTTILAQALFHFFYAKTPLHHYDIRDIMIGALYLACKSEETLRNRFQIVAVFDFIFKAYENSHKNVNAIQVGSIEYEQMKNQTLIQAEIDILFELGFEIYRLSDLPHRYIGAFLTLFEKHPKFQLFSKQAWHFLNDFYMTTVCLHFPPQILVAAAVYMAMKDVEAGFPDVPWWVLMEANFEAIQFIETEVKSVKQCQGLMNMAFVGKRITEVSESLHGLLNVFPVPYYRKIMLEKRKKLRISKNQTITQEELQKCDNASHPNFIDEGNHEKKKESKEAQMKEKADIEEIAGDKKLDKTNLLSKLNMTLKKHEGKLEKKIRKDREDREVDSSEEEDEEIRLLAELRKKVKANKEGKHQQT